MNDAKSGSMKRREFIRAASALSAVTMLQPLTSSAQQTTAKIPRLFITSYTRKHEAGVAPALGPVDQSSLTESVTVDSSQRYQPMLGFGAAYTDASCFLLQSMRPEERQKFLVATFSPDKMNLSVGRATIGASDYSRNVYSYDDVAGDVEMKSFSIAHDEQYILPMLREMRRINPDLFLLATPWSPPGWMKTYGSMLGGWMTNKSLAPYALYLSRFLDAYRAAGVPLQSITSQNEVEVDQGGHMPAAYWTPEMESDFIRDHLGPLLKKKNDPTEIWLLDHNYELWKRVRWQMQDAQLRKFVSGVAWHGYVGTADMMSRLHEVEPQLPFYWTEGGPDISDSQYASDWTRWGAVFTEAIGNWCRCIMTWNLMLDARGNPNIGPFTCGGLVTLKDDRTVACSGQYRALRHFSQHVQRGAVRIASHSDASELSHVAFENKDGSRILVLTNNGEQRDLRIIVQAMETRLNLEKHSMATIIL